MDAVKFGESIRKIRKEMNLTLDDLGKKAGFKKSYLSLIENGKQGIPQPETLRKLSQGLNVDYHMLMLMAGYIDSKEFTEKKIYKMAMKEMQEKLNQIGENLQENDADAVERLNKELKMIRKEALKNVDSLNDGAEAKYLKDIYFDFFKLDMSEYGLFYKGVELSHTDIDDIQKFIETFVINKEGD